MVRFTSTKRFLLSAVCFWLTAALSNAANAQVPDAPTGATVIAGNGSVSVAFAAPGNSGGSAITSFTATCGSQSNTGGASPIVVNTPAGVAVSCTVVATNASGNSVASAASNNATPVLLTAVLSRKTHGSAGDFDLPIDRTQTIGGLVTVEPRTIGNGHTIVFQFNGTIPTGWTASVSLGNATVAPTTTSEVVVTLTNISDNQRVMVTLTNVAGAVSLPPVSMGFLVGDVNNSRTVNSSDVSTVKARAGQTTNTANFLYDINASGSINSSDISTIKSRAGSILVTGGAVAIISAAPPPATTDVTYCHPFTASETIQQGGWTMSATAPAWVTLNAKRGVICGIPRSPADVGTTTFNVSATNGISTATQTVTLTVGVITLPPPVITSGAPATATTDLTYCHPFTASQAIPSGAWTVSAGTATPEWITLNSKRGVICGIPRTADIGTSTFTISATNANGTSPQAVTLTVSGVALVVLSVSPMSALVGATVTINGTGLSSVTSVKIGTVDATPFTVNSAGTSITTTVPAAALQGLGSVVLGTATNPTAATASFVVLGPGSGDFSNDPIPVSLPAVSKFPFAIPSHDGLNGAGTRVNAYSMDPARCNTTPALRRSWQHNIDLADYRQRVASDLFAMQGDEALTYKITIPTTDAAGGFLYQDNVGSGGIRAAAFMSISATPCDFDVTKIPYVPTSPTKQCYQLSGAGGGIAWANFATGQPNDYVYCKLTKGQTYYVNIRFVDGATPSATTCPTGLCGGGFTFN